MADQDPKVTVGAGEPSSPSAELVRKSLQETVLTLEDGRKVTLRKPGILAQYRLTEAMGPVLAANQTWMQMVLPFLWVAAIDGDPVQFPNSKLEMEILINRLGEDGHEQVLTYYITTVVGPMNDAVDRATREAEERAALKN